MQQSTSQTIPLTIAEELDRLEIIAGKVGLISRENAYTLLKGLDSTYREIQGMAPDSPSRRIAETQWNTILAKIQTESAQFLRDLGGPEVLRQARAAAQPPAEHTWWYIDALVVSRRKDKTRRMLIVAGGVLAVLLVLIFVYNRFFAPDPAFVAVYGHEQMARDQLMAGELEGALEEVEQGLAINPQEVSLLLMKGVIMESLGQPADAEHIFSTARNLLDNDTNFYIARGQTYLYINNPEKALEDVEQALELDPESAQALLLSGHTYEAMGMKPEALLAYENAYDAAEARGEVELAALARAQMAFLIQGSGGANYLTPVPQDTAAP